MEKNVDNSLTCLTRNNSNDKLYMNIHLNVYLDQKQTSIYMFGVLKTASFSFIYVYHIVINMIKKSCNINFAATIKVFEDGIKYSNKYRKKI